MRCVFWLSLGVLLYTYVGYSLWLRLLCRSCDRKWQKKFPETPPLVTVLLVVYNEEDRIVNRLKNLLDSTYPGGQLEILVVSDGSTDAGIARANALGEKRIRTISIPERSGKAFCLNEGMREARGEIVVFADARQSSFASAISELVANFHDPQVGAVSGSLEIDPAGTSGGTGVDLYWKIEKSLRADEARYDSSIGCTGAIWAMRRDRFQPMPVDTILDDVVNPMQVATQGARVVFDEAAIARDPQSLEPSREKIRKRRTLAGNFQMLFRYPGWLLPSQNRLWWQLISHKYLRLVAPLILVLLFVSNALIASTPAYKVAFVGQLVFYSLAAIGLVFPRLRFRLVSIPAGFCFLNLMVVAGFWQYLRSPGHSAWASVKH
jgi:cellulose synthase/poly-beta-1,6-N-acetylglucosamine synthase-like glycosyltransferase